MGSVSSRTGVNGEMFQSVRSQNALWDTHTCAAILSVCGTLGLGARKIQTFPSGEGSVSAEISVSLLQ